MSPPLDAGPACEDSVDSNACVAGKASDTGLPYDTVAASPATASGDRSIPTYRLVDFLERHGSTLDENAWNEIACQVLNLHHALLNDQSRSVNHDVQSWLIHADSHEVVFPWTQAASAPAAQRAQGLLADWTRHLARWNRVPVKPDKIVYGAVAQEQIQRDLFTYLEREVFPKAGVSRVYLMGASLRGDMGHYVQPYVTDLAVKLGSDVDLLIEYSEDMEDRLPPDWQCHYAQTAESGCAFYLLGELPLHAEAKQTHTQRLPSIPFRSHLLAAYLYFPSRCDAAQKDSFLQTYQAKLIFDRHLAPPLGTPRGAASNDIETLIRTHYDLTSMQLEALQENSASRLYSVDSAECRAILKISTESGTYHRSRLRAHARYEAELIVGLRARGIDTPAVIPARDGLTVEVGAHEGILFERFAGQPLEKPEYPVDAAARALAAIHAVQVKSPLTVDRSFHFEDHCRIWLPHFELSRRHADLPAELQLACDVFAPLADRYRVDQVGARLLMQGAHVHCHGDVKPRNVFYPGAGRVVFFDFDNAMYGPRLSDVMDGAINFALAEQYIEQADFSRCDAFIVAYCEHARLSCEEHAALSQWLDFSALLHFTREVTTWVQTREDIRRRRALALASYIARQGTGAASEA